MINPRKISIEHGAILYDEARIDTFASHYFEPDYWRSRALVELEAPGRGSTLVVRMQDERWVLRHYLRGGLFGKVVDDSYLWSGERRTRCFREWQLLADLTAADLPVPEPIAARYIRTGVRYTADLITGYLADTVTVSKALADMPLNPDVWHKVGECIRRFHEAGVYHADLNAHNILLGAAHATVYIIDFDRGYFRPGNDWKKDNLNRLRRSLEKVTKGLEGRFGDKEWEWLMLGYGERG